jgi:hypothetical protein
MKRSPGLSYCPSDFYSGYRKCVKKIATKNPTDNVEYGNTFNEVIGYSDLTWAFVNATIINVYHYLSNEFSEEKRSDLITLI